MKFAHLADCHIGGWREPKLRELSIKSLTEAINISIKENVAFVIIAGDLFDTALPSIELIKDVADILRKLAEAEISCYIVPGSHDYSASGKTMLDVLEKAGLLENVSRITEEENKINLKFTQDKTGVKITGLLGKRLGLDKHDYEKLEKKYLEEEPGFKIFIFHTLLEEFKPDYLSTLTAPSLKILPKNFNYYAGGHPHFISHAKLGKGIIAYPGPIFPNNFAELEKLNHGGFYIVEINNEIKPRYIPLKFKEVLTIDIDVDGKTSHEAENFILNRIKEQNTEDKIILLRISGIIDGKISDINFKMIMNLLSDSYTILKNTQKLTTKDTELKIEGSIDEVELKLIKDNLKGLKEYDEEKLIQDLIHLLDVEKEEGERNIDFEKRVLSSLEKIMKC